MFLFFKTSMNFDSVTFRPRINFDKGSYFFHSNDTEYGLKICLFGQYAIFLLIFILIARHYINIPKKLVLLSLVIAFIISLINLNAVVYLLPIWIYEIYNYLQ
tara:strand:+ start:821 stop:1129 length:309 start_codon:yes stop_codon:yes gene_type:complete